MNYVFKIIIVANFLFFTEGVMSQTRFKATVLGGLNLSQIDGDKQQGYRKSGISLGLNGSIFVRHDFDISTELLFNEKGARPNPNIGPTQNTNYSNFAFQYSEIALLFNYHYNLSRSRNYYTQALTAGISYGRLLKSTTSIIRNNTSFTSLESEVANHYNPNDISFIVGWSQLLTPKFGFALRHTGSLNFLYQNAEYHQITNDSGFGYLKPYFLSFHVFYNFISPAKVMELKKKNRGHKNDPLEELY